MTQKAYDFLSNNLANHVFSLSCGRQLKIFTLKVSGEALLVRKKIDLPPIPVVDLNMTIEFKVVCPISDGFIDLTGQLDIKNYSGDSLSYRLFCDELGGFRKEESFDLPKIMKSEGIDAINDFLKDFVRNKMCS